jgi:RHS repeat-associated protein
VAGSLNQASDRAGRVTSDGRSLTGISGDAGTGTQSFTYDALSRLTGSTGLAVSSGYQYDLDGNRTQKVEGGTTTTYTYDRADQVANQVIGATTRTYDYDRYGNLLTSADNTSAVITYAYDEASRLTTISPPGGATTQVTFTLDALDRHASRLVNAATTDTYQYLDATETAWQTGQATPTSSLLDADGSRLAVKTGSTVSWLLFDLHGSVVAMCTSGTSTLTDAYRFDGFGQQIASSGTAANPWRFRGLLNIGADTLTGALLDMGARDYSPQLGVFTQQDSVQGAAANPMTMNRFLYALANPATLIDPDGHMVPATDGPYYPAPAQVGDGVDCSQKCIDAGQGGGGVGGGSGAPEAEPVDLKKLGEAHLPELDKNYALYFGEYTICGQAASGLVIGNPSSHLMCLQGSLGADLGLAAFLYFYHGEYDAGIDIQIRQGIALGTMAVGLIQLLRYGGAALINRLGGSAREPLSTGLSFNDRQLQSQMAQHGEDFGFDSHAAGKPAARQDYMSALVDHIESPSTLRIPGTYRGDPATSYVDVATRRVVVVQPEGGFWVAWKLSEDQLWNLLKSGDLR